jgi:NTP pyrophosphatase (non-canonical NTP hydrolase)
MLELAGEVGEACNIAKKLALHQMGIPVASSDVRTLIDELADVAICLALVANKLGIDLGESVARKFNATSRKHGFSDTLPETNQTIPPIFQTP